MRNIVVLSLGVLLAFLVSDVSAHCCGRGHHYFCNDCSIVTHYRSITGRKCCYAGSRYYHGCNAFCCNCRQCTTGNALISHVSGYWTKKTYKCSPRPVHKYKTYNKYYPTRGDEELASQTEKAFDEIDKDGDRTLTPDEFFMGLKTHLGMDTGDLLASELSQTSKRDEAFDFADAIASDDVNEEDLADFEKMAYQEFEAMDANKDGLIQAREFDKDLDA